MTDPQEFDINELSTLSGHSVRNIRAYLTNKLLQPGERRGRSLVFNQSHVRRLRQVDTYRERGYSLAAIEDVLRGEDGAMLAADVATFASFVGQWQSDDDHLLTFPEVRKVLPVNDDRPVTLQAAIDRDLVRVVEDGLRIVRPEMFRAGLDLITAGMNITDVIDELDGLDEAVGELAVYLVDRFEHLFLESAQANTDGPVTTPEFWPAILMASASILSRRVHKEIEHLNTQPADTQPADTQPNDTQPNDGAKSAKHKAEKR